MHPQGVRVTCGLPFLMEPRNTYRLLITWVKETKKLPSLVTLDGADTYSAITRYLKVLLPSSVSSYSSVRISKQLNAMDVLTAGGGKWYENMY